MRSITTTSTALVFALLLAGCGDGATAGTGDTDGLELPDDPQTVILDVRTEGGFAPVEMIIGRVPPLVLTAGRTLYYQGPVPAIYPGPLLPNIQSVQLDDETFQAVLDYVRDIGFPGFDELVNRDAADRVADAPNTVVTWYDGDGEHRFDVYALGIDQVTDARVAQLNSLVEMLQNGAARGESAGEYRADRIEVNAGVREIPVEGQFENVRPWPLPDAYGDMTEVFPGWRCAVYSGEQAQGLLEEFRDANQATSWELDGERYTLVVRPLFPHEEGCSN